MSVRTISIYFFFSILLLMNSLESFGQIVRPAPFPKSNGTADTTAVADSTKNKRVKILNSDILNYEQKDGVGIQKLLGNVRLKQDSTLFVCDSAYYFDKENRLEAFGHVRIEMKDSVFLYSDLLTYDANSKVAEVYDNIRLTNQDVVLSTDRLTYFREEDYGYYREKGKLEDGETTLTSEYGYYYPSDDMAYFRRDVVLVNPDYSLYTDTLGYNTETKVATFLTYTLIDSKDGDIETTRGYYDTEAGYVQLFTRSIVRDSSYVLIADSLYYNEKESFGVARGNVVVRQEDSTLQLRGQYGQFDRETDESMLTKNPVAIQLFDEDTLYVFADTLLSLKKNKFIYELPKQVETDSVQVDSLSSIGTDSLSTDSVLVDTVRISSIDSTSLDTTALISSPDSAVAAIDSVTLDSIAVLVPQDSLNVIPDSLATSEAAILAERIPIDTVEYRLFKAYHNVRFYMGDMQGKADSMVYFYDDSVIYLMEDPILWSDENQITGDTIIVWMKNEKADSMWIGAKGFLASKEDTVGFNQLKGKEIRAKFRDNELVWLNVIGNGESIFFAKNDDDSTNVYYEGMNKALAKEITMFLKDNEVQRILFRTNPEGTFLPFYEVIFKENNLDGMKWREDERPEKPLLEIYPVDTLAPQAPENQKVYKEVQPPKNEKLPDSDPIPPEPPKLLKPNKARKKKA